MMSGQLQRKAGRFYPTRLAINLTAHRTGTTDSLNVVQSSANEQKSSSNEKESQQRTGYIIVETNYRVYAYTNSSLQVALLGLFTELLYRCVILENHIVIIEM